MDEYEKQIIKNTYDILSEALKSRNHHELIIDAMAQLETIGIFERDALLRDPSIIPRCEHCGGPTHEEDILVCPDGLMPHLVCEWCGYQWVPESIRI